MVCATLFSSMTSLPSCALECSEDETNVTYLEEKYQINFTDLNVESDGKNLTLSAKENLSKPRSSNADESIEKLENIFERFPDVEENLISCMEEDGELLAVSFTEVPLVKVNGHYERVNSASRDASVSDDTEKGDYFLLYTSISGGDDAYYSGYRYRVVTYSSWQYVDYAGGSIGQATGDDQVIQACPTTFTRYSNNMTAKYNISPTSGSSSDYALEDGGAYWTQYSIVDAPGTQRHLVNCQLETINSAPQSSDNRMINSWYVHTWDEMSVKVTLSAGTSSGVTLNITPESTSKSWKVYNSLSFNF